MATRYVNTASSAGGDGTTNATGGANRAYVSLNAWEAARQAVLSEIEECICEGTAADSTAVTIDGWTTTSSYYIDIKALSSASAGRHAGVYSTSKYRLELSSSDFLLNVLEAYTRATGIQIYNTFNSGGDNNPGLIGPSSASMGASCIFDSIIGRGVVNGALYPKGFIVGATNKYINCIAYDVSYAAGSRGAGFARISGAYSGLCYNCTAHSCYQGFLTPDEGATAAQQLLVKNCLAAGCTDGFFAAWQFGTGSNYNASDLASDAPGANSRNSQTFTFVDAANDNFHLASTDAGGRGYGTDLSGDATYAFSGDIDGQTRSGSWDIGADEYIAAGGGAPLRRGPRIYNVRQAVKRAASF